MDCKGVLRHLTDHLHGEAREKIRRRIEEHLDGCERCRMHVDRMKMIIRLYKDWRDDRIPRDVSIRLADLIAKEAGGRPGKKGRGTGVKAAKKPGRKVAKRPARKCSRKDSRIRRKRD